MATVSATVLGMAKAGKTKKEAMAWLVKYVISKAPQERREKLTIQFAKAVLNTWGSSSDKEKASGWYLLTAGLTPKMATERLQGAYDKLIAVNKYMRGKVVGASARWLPASK